jgi:hypothetical protein
MSANYRILLQDGSILTAFGPEEAARLATGTRWVSAVETYTDAQKMAFTDALDQIISAQIQIGVGFSTDERRKDGGGVR